MSEALKLDPQPTQPDLYLVPSPEAAGASTEQLNDKIAELNRFTQVYVPESPAKAREYIDHLQGIASHVRKSDAGYEAFGHEVEDGLAEELLGAASQGTDYWNLSDEGKKIAGQIVQTRSYGKLPVELRADVRSQKLSDTETNSAAFERYKQKAAARLKLSEALDAEYAQSQAVAAPQTDHAQENVKTKSRPGQVGGVKSKGLSHLLATDEDLPQPGELGKEADRLLKELRRTSHDTPAQTGTSESAGTPATSAAEEAPQSKASPKASQRRAGIKDLVSLDGNGRAHYTSGVKVVDGQAVGKLNGKFMTKHELDMIEAHADQIREGAKERERILGLRENSKNLMTRMYGEAEYAERFADNPNVDPDAWKAREYGNEPAYEAKHRAENRTTEELPADVDEAFWGSLSDEERAFWFDANADEKQNLRDAKTAPSSATKALELYNKQSTELEPYEPVTDTTPKGLKARWNRMVGKAWAKLQSMKTGVGEYYGDEEKGRRRKKILGGLIGAGALIGTGVAIYLETRGGGVSHHATSGNHHPQGGGTGGHHHEAVVHKPKVAHQTLKSGHTIYGDLRDYAHQHGANPSDKLLMQESAKVLHENPQIGGWNGARHMQAGEHYNIRQSILNDLLKRSKKR